MRHRSPSQKLLVDEIMRVARKLQTATRGLPIGDLIKTIRKHLGMSQQVLAKRAGVPQSTVSRIESGQKDMSLSTLRKILGALSCDLVIAPVLKDSIDALRQKQARKLAKLQVNYLRGTMNLENQQPDPRFIEEILKQEEERLLQGPNTKLWQE